MAITTATCTYSVVVAVFNEEEVLPHFYDRLTRVLDTLDGSSEIIFINDGSSDQSPLILHELHRRDPRVKVIHFARNFGHEIAVIAGLDYASGEATIIMDADLQDPPEVIPDLAAKWREGYEVVYAQRAGRAGETGFKKITAAWYYRLMRAVTSIDLPVDTGNFRLMGRRALKAVTSMRERHRFLRGMVCWVGFRQAGVSYERAARAAGETKYPLRKMVKLAKDGIYSFSRVPLELASYLGFVIAVFAFLMLIWVFVDKMLSHNVVPGWASTMSAILFLGAVQLICLGIIGDYLGRIYDEVRGRPLYIVDEVEGL
ncbi:MAG: glycosyltransferase family 2 protein [bacterium]